MAVLALALSFSVPSALTVIVIVIVMSRAAPGDFVVHGDEVGVMTTNFDDSIRRDAVVVGEEPHVNEVHHVVVSEDDRVPLLARLLLVVSPRLAVRRSWRDDDRYVSRASGTRRVQRCMYRR